MPQTFYCFVDRQQIYTFIFLYEIWLGSPENCRRSSVLKSPAPCGPVLTKNSNCHKIFNFQQIAKIFPHDWNTYDKVWLKLNEICGNSSLLKMSTLEILQSALNDPNWTQRIGHEKYCTYAVPRIASPKFASVSSTINCFQYITHFTIFLLTHMLQFQSATFLLKFWKILEPKTRGPWTLPICLTTALGMTNGNILQTCTCIKNTLMQSKTIEI